MYPSLKVDINAPQLSAALTFARSWELQKNKQGRNDIDVEVFRNNEWTVVNLSNVRVNEFFQLLNEEGEVKSCYLCKRPAFIDSSYSKTNPTISLCVVEIVTRPETSRQVNRIGNEDLLTIEVTITEIKD